jgi:hypothetical protein
MFFSLFSSNTSLLPKQIFCPQNSVHCEAYAKELSHPPIMTEFSVPASLKPIERYLKTANQLDKHQPVMAYFCRVLVENFERILIRKILRVCLSTTLLFTLTIQLLGRYYAVHLGIELRTKAPDQENKQFLHALMDRLEKVCSQSTLTFLNLSVSSF